MFKQLRTKWNVHFTMALGNLGIAYIMLFNHSIDHSLIMFALTGIILSLGNLSNKLKDNHGTN